MAPGLLNGSHEPRAIAEADDELEVCAKYRPFLLPPDISRKDWVAQLELSGVEALVQQSMSSAPGTHLRVLILQGSLREGLVKILFCPHHQEHSRQRRKPALALTMTRSVSRLLALECARILFRLRCDVRVFDPSGLPLKDSATDKHLKVQELRHMSDWSEGQIWVSPEQHGNMVSLPLCCLR